MRASALRLYEYQHKNTQNTSCRLSDKQGRKKCGFRKRYVSGASNELRNDIVTERFSGKITTRAIIIVICPRDVETHLPPCDHISPSPNVMPRTDENLKTWFLHKHYKSAQQYVTFYNNEFRQSEHNLRK